MAPKNKRKKPSRAEQLQKAIEAKRTTVHALMAKARVLAGAAIDETSALTSMFDDEEAWGDAGAVVPPYDPESLLNYIELCPHVTPNISAYEQNIEGFGYQSVPIEPWMADLSSEDAEKAVRAALEVEMWMDAQEEALQRELEEQAKAAGKKAKKSKKSEEDDDLDEETSEDMEVTDEEVKEKLSEIEDALRREKYVFDAFFKHVCSEMSFIDLRRAVRSDYESHGWGCMEMIRDTYKRLKRLKYVPGYTVRPLKDEGKVVEVLEDDSITPISDGREIKVLRRFRRYVQRVNGQKIYFKSPGDPRVVSQKTGKVYKDVDTMVRKETKEGNNGKKDIPQEANELLWMAQHSPKTPCPPPRWIGNLLAVLGTREADEVNYFYFNRKGIPPGLLFVSGGSIPRQLKERIEGRLASELYGTDNFHKMLVVEATPMKTEPGVQPQLPQLKFESLFGSQHTDQLFSQYDVRNSDRIGSSFRLPRLLRGETKDFNRATALASLRFAEQQVFQPERDRVDWIYNKYIVPEIGVKYLLFKSNSPPTRSSEEITEIVKAAAPHGGLVPYEIRELMGDVLNRPLEEIEEAWTKQPMTMTLAGLTSGSAAGGADAETQGALQELDDRVADVENRVGEALAAELRSLGYDMDVTARLIDRPEGGDDDIESEDGASDE